MTFPGQGGFPGMGAAPGAPQAPVMGIGGGFVLDIPPDATWEPFDTTDTLEKDGYYCAKIAKEAPRNDGTKSPGVFLTLSLEDEDVKGKILSKFMTDPRVTKGNTWWSWRSLIRSITGGLDQARAGFRYTPGAFIGHTIYVKTGAYNDDGATRTGVDAFITRAEWEVAIAAGKHRWAAQVKAPIGAVGALPGGLPNAFPTSAFPGLPGGPSAPVPGGAPMQGTAPQMQPAPAQTFEPQVQAPPQQQFAPPQTPGGFTGGFGAPTSPFGAPPPVAMPTQPGQMPLQQPFAAAPGQQYVPPPAPPGSVPQPVGTLPTSLFPGTAPNGTQ